MSKFISDEEMEKLESSQPKGFVSNEKMFELEKKKSPLESSVRGAIQGIPAIGPWADEIEGGVKSIFGDDYKTERDRARNEYKLAEMDNPVSYNAGIMAPTLAVAPIKGVPVIGTGLGALLGGIEGAGASEEEDFDAIAKDAALSSLISAGTAGIGNKLAPKISGLVSKSGNALGDSAEKLAIKSTGATGNQVSKFEEGAGRELLDRKLIRAGDSPENIAKRLGAESERAGQSIGDILSNLDNRGVTANIDNVVDNLNSQIARLSKDPSKADEVRRLQTFVDDIINVGESKIPISMAEETKRGFRKKSGNWMDPESGAAAKKVYLSYMDEAEQAAKNAQPELADLFKKEKETFGLLSPIQEAAEKRAAQQNQSPFGGLLDVATIGAGGAAGGEEGLGAGFAMAALRRGGAKRLASTGAVGLDKLSSLLKASPQSFGKFSKVLLDASQRGGNALGAAHFILQQKSPEYRQHLISMQEEEK